MSTQPPLRATLHSQLVTLLRDGIQKAHWVEDLPSEGELCREFHVSRMTLRKALAQLANERWISLGGRGSVHHICERQIVRQAPTARTIRVLTPFSLAAMGTIEHQLMETLSERISAAGYRLESEHHPRLFEKIQPEKLARLNALPGTAAWLLFFATEDIQRWFSASGRPTVVVGRVHEDLPLSSIYPDSEAAARHAAGLLCSRGHRDVVYLMGNLTSLNERLASAAFVAEAKKLGASARVVTHDADSVSVARVVQDLIFSRPRPTGFVIGAPEVSIALVCHLQAAGIGVPHDSSIISLWADDFLSYAYPAISCYHTNGKLMGRHISRSLLGLIQNGPGRILSTPVIPEYVPGGSLGPGILQGRISG
jgi:DNA-binding LacI/PurR family transcriptional regulator